MRRATRYLGLLAVMCLALAAAGCTGSNLLPTGNSSLAVSFEIVGEGGTSIEYDCVNFLLSAMSVRPLDGICASTAANAGEACLDQSDCVGGPCEGSAADTLISGGGIGVVSADPANPTAPGNLLGETCSLSKRCNATGPICANASECGPGEVCVLPYGNSSAADPFIPPNTLTLAEGLYEVNEFTFSFLMFSDAPAFRACTDPSDYVDSYDDTLRFFMPADGTKNLVFRIDVAELEDALVSGCGSFTPEIVPDVVECQTCDAAP